MFREAKSGASHVLGVFEKLGAMKFVVEVRQLLGDINRNNGTLL
jgi:hypothetical protein